MKRRDRFFSVRALSGVILASALFADVGEAAPSNCRQIPVAQNQLPLVVTLFRIADGRVEEAGDAKRQTFGDQMVVNDCNNATFFSWAAPDRTIYLIRRSQVMLEKPPCICLSQGTRQAGAPMGGQLEMCHPAC